MNDLALRAALHRDADLVGEPSPDLLDQLVRRRQHQRRQRAGILAVAAAVVVIGGGIPVVSSLTMQPEVAPATQPTIVSTPPATTEAARTTSAAPSSSADPTTAPADPDPEPAALVLGPDGLGPLKLGMSLSEAEATGMLEPRAGDWPPGTGCRPQFRLSDDPAGTSVVWYSDALGLAAVHVGAGVQTPEGISIGSSLDDVERAYPGWDHSYHVLRGVAPVTGEPELAYRIGFSKGGIVTELALQHYMNGCYE